MEKNNTKFEPDLYLLLKGFLEAGGTIKINDAGFPAGVYVQGKPFDINTLFPNCQDTKS